MHIIFHKNFIFENLIFQNFISFYFIIIIIFFFQKKKKKKKISNFTVHSLTGQRLLFTIDRYCSQLTVDCYCSQLTQMLLLITIQSILLQYNTLFFNVSWSQYSECIAIQSSTPQAFSCNTIFSLHTSILQYNLAHCTTILQYNSFNSQPLLFCHNTIPCIATLFPATNYPKLQYNSLSCNTIS